MSEQQISYSGTRAIAAQLETQFENVFGNVIRSYVTAQSLPRICAMNYDPTVPNVGKWTPKTSEFIADVENVTRRALGGDPKQMQVWDSLVHRVAYDLGATAELPPSVLLKDASVVIQKVGKAYFRATLDPALYFRTIKTRSEDAWR